ELESDTRIGLADEERCLTRRGDALYVTLGQNARAHLPFCGPQNEPDKHYLSRREILSALSDRSAILLFCSCTSRLEPAGHFVPRVLRGLEQCAGQDAEIGVRLFCSDCPCRYAEDRCDDYGRVPHQPRSFQPIRCSARVTDKSERADFLARVHSLR